MYMQVCKEAGSCNIDVIGFGREGKEKGGFIEENTGCSEASKCEKKKLKQLCLTGCK